MSIGRLLFSMNGHATRAEFFKGAFVLLILNFVLWMGWFVHKSVGILGMMIAVFSIYCWACLFAKRLREAGQPGGWFVSIFGVFVFITGLISIFVFRMRTGQILAENPNLVAIKKELDRGESANRSPEEMNQVLDYYQTLGEASILPIAFVFLCVGGSIALIFNLALSSKS